MDAFQEANWKEEKISFGDELAQLNVSLQKRNYDSYQYIHVIIMFLFGYHILFCFQTSTFFISIKKDLNERIQFVVS